MNKNKMFILLPLVVSFVCACSSNKSNPKPTPEPTPSPVPTPEPTPSPEPTPTPTPEPEEDWLIDVKEMMEEHLFGEVLPFLDKDNLVIEYDEEYQEFTISGGVINEGDLPIYALKYDNAGWTGGDISLYNKLPLGTVFNYQKEIILEEGKRFLDVTFYALKDGFYSKSGSFYLLAYSPYIYEFPKEDLEYFVKTYFGSDISIPEIEADYYDLSYSEAYISMYYESSLDDGGYTSLLKDNKWDVKEEKVDDYYYATSPDGLYVIHYLYLDKYKALDIYFDTVKEFPDEQIKDFFEKYNVKGIEVPTLLGALGGYTFLENPNNQTFIDMGYPENISATVYCYSASYESFENYLTLLEELGWNISYSSYSASATMKLENGIYTMYMSYSLEGYVSLVVMGYIEEYGDDDWPKEEIEKLIGDDLKDTIPAFEGEHYGYKVLNDNWGYAVYVQVEKGKELEAVESYKETLLDNGYKFDHFDALGDSYYISPNNEIMVGVYYGTPGSITIPFELVD